MTKNEGGIWTMCYNKGIETCVNGWGDYLNTWLHVMDDKCGCCSMHINSLQQLTMNKWEPPDVIFSENSGDNNIQQMLTLIKKSVLAGTQCVCVMIDGNTKRTTSCVAPKCNMRCSSFHVLVHFIF